MCSFIFNIFFLVDWPNNTPKIYKDRYNSNENILVQGVGTNWCIHTFFKVRHLFFKMWKNFGTTAMLWKILQQNILQWLTSCGDTHFVNCQIKVASTSFNRSYHEFYYLLLNTQRKAWIHLLDAKKISSTKKIYTK